MKGGQWSVWPVHPTGSLTHTLRPADVRGVARFACTAVGAQRVDALTVLAQVAHHPTLIDIWEEKQDEQRDLVSTDF